VGQQGEVVRRYFLQENLNEPVDPPRPRGPLDLVNGSRGVVIAWDHLPPLLNRELENGGVMLKGEN
jgi:hypothetical protein